MLLHKMFNFFEPGGKNPEGKRGGRGGGGGDWKKRGGGFWGEGGGGRGGLIPQCTLWLSKI